MAAPETRLLIGGELVPGDGAGIEVENPFTEQTIATVNAPSDEQLGSAIAAARESSREWMRTPAVDRGELLHEVANRIESRADASRHIIATPRVESSSSRPATHEARSGRR